MYFVYDALYGSNNGENGCVHRKNNIVRLDWNNAHWMDFIILELQVCVF